MPKDREHIVNVASHVRNPDTYYDRVIQDWHMLNMPKDHDAIDLDLFGVCHSCRQPLYMIEGSSDPKKATSILQALSRRTGTPGLLMLSEDSVFTRWRLVGEPGDWQDPAAAVKYLTLVRRAHDVVQHPRRPV